MAKEINIICICGGGNLGIVCAGVFLSKGIKVNILTGHPDKWNTDIEVTDPDGRIFGGTLNKISSDPSEVVPQADMILLTIPGNLIEDTLNKIKPFIKKSALIGSVVATTGFFFVAHEILGNDNILFGFQRVPYIARIREYGKGGDLLGYKSSLSVAIENSSDPASIRELLENVFNTPVNLLNNFYEASLSNSNPLLHTARLYSMWKDFDGNIFESRSLFYMDWTQEASRLLIEMDKEFQRLLRKLDIEQEVIPSVLDYYDSTDAESLTEKIRSIPAFKSIKSPMIKSGDGWIPDFSSRYFSEDFPFGLRFIKELANKNGVECPVIEKVYSWGTKLLAEDIVPE